MNHLMRSILYKKPIIKIGIYFLALVLGFLVSGCMSGDAAVDDKQQIVEFNWSGNGD